MPERLRLPLMLAPALAVILLFFGGGLVLGIAQSVDYLPLIGLNQLTLRHYSAILSERQFLISLLLTLYIALAATLLSTGLALIVAMTLRQHFVGRRWVSFIFQIPLPVPHLVAASGIVLLLTQSGLFARLLYSFGALAQPADFPILVFDRWNVATILVYVWKETPFIGLTVLAILQGVGQEYEELAQTLGATAWQRFRYVLLPLLLPGILSTSIIVFAYMFGSFEIPLLLGQRYPSVLPVLAYRAYSDPDLARRPEAMAMGVVIALITMGLLAAYRKIAYSLSSR